MALDYVARAGSERGEVVLRRRERDGALELRVNGVFVMDTAETSAEWLLARAALDAARAGRASRLRVLIGGLGLGFTLAEALRDERVIDVIVAEIEPALVEWHRRGLVPDTADALLDSRVRVEVGDVADVVAAQPAGTLDVILLDIDNVPGHLVYDANAAVYRTAFLTTCREVMRVGGVTAIWSAGSSTSLREAFGQVFGHCQELTVPVRLGRRETSYHLFMGRRLP